MISLKLGHLPPLQRFSIAIFSFVFIIAGIAHIVATDLAIPYMPYWLPFKWHLIFWTGFTEIIGGLGLLMSKYRKYAAWFLLLHLVSFLLVHGWHVWIGGQLNENALSIPIWLTWLRLFFQFILIWLMWKITKLHTE